MKTVADLIMSGKITADTKVVGVPTLTEDGHLILDSASLFKATPHGVERVVAMSCEGHEDDEAFRPSLFARCYAERRAAEAVMPEIVEKAAEARRRVEALRAVRTQASARAADGRGTEEGPTCGRPQCGRPSSPA
jgi:hypothetical protein